jgi:zinc protease
MAFSFKGLLSRGKRDFLRRGWIALLIALVLPIVASNCVHRPSKSLSPFELPMDRQEGWPHTQSDLQPDPSLITGQLENGFRYILKQNKTPLDRVSMHLYVQSGSLNETEAEQGIAHFLEHMLFNGSTHFPPGEMVKYFQRIGMQFGPDANAHTGFAQTVYDVILPEGSAKSIGEGLLVLSDYAQGALLLADETDREKKVILAEMRTRDSAEFRVIKESFGFEMPGGLIARRFPIGLQKTIESIDANMLRHFYDTWYRPERMILVAVGDFRSEDMIPQIENAFNGLQARLPAAVSPSLGHFTHNGIKAFHRYEGEMGATSVRIDTIEQVARPTDSKDWQHRQLLQRLADQIVQRRLEVLLQNPGTDFNDADISSGTYLQHIRYAEISADCQPQHWSQTLATLEQELRRALKYGFTTTEVEQVKRSYLAQLSRAVEERNTRNSNSLARSIMGSLGSWQVFQSPEQRQAVLGPMVEAATADQLHQTFRDTWRAPHRLLLVTGNAELASSDRLVEDQILAAYQGSTQVAVAPPVEKQTLAFPYLPAPQTAGTIDIQKSYADIGVSHVSYKNGVQLLLKPTTYKENQVLVALSFSGGRAAEPIDQPGLAHLTESVVNASGFGRMDPTDLEAALSGRVARIALDVGEDRFVVKGETLSTELDLMVQLLHTFLKDPGFRPEAYQLAQKRFDQMNQSMVHTVEGALRLNGIRFLAGGDPRFGTVGSDQMKNRSLEQIRKWFGGMLTTAPIEVAIVGDFQTQEAVELVGRYFGSLAPRASNPFNLRQAMPEFPKGQSLELSVESSIDKSMVVVAYPTDDFWNIRKTRRLSIMADVFSERLREHIRENLGAAYSPFAYNRGYRAYPGFGLFQVYLTVSPQQADLVVDEVKKISLKLIKEGISEDEFRRSLDPTLTGIKDLRQTNTYWLNNVLVGASRHPEQFMWAQTIEADYAAIQSDEILELANRYLDNSKSAVIVISPKPSGTP